MISARETKQLDVTTMFTYSHANTPLGQSEHAYYLSYFIKEYCYSPLDGMLVHSRVTPQEYVAGTHLFTWMKRDKVE